MSEPTPTPAPAPVSRRSLWRSVRGGGAVLGLIVVVLALAHRPLLVGFANQFRVDNPAPSDALILLLGGADHRPRKALELYRRGLAPIILLAESGVQPVLKLDESELTRQYLVDEGVPAAAVQILPGGKVKSTRDEAIRVRAYARTQPIRRVTIVTTAFHTARGRWIFRRSLRGLNIDIRMAAADHPAFHEANWYHTEEGLVLYFAEFIKTLFYRLSY
ncbi:DUF218 domain-containing protein [Singulisphaera sp. GP187]|uniref:YdcF family protein n=1 Tax=Singulisphaera sp. GP187 TaxID=1882752 RepID=UPI00092C856C|nr:YdcF family protein [Singulisphaera sp. GP187]SIO55257.1 DUF218 domain-containing protein [Singulisphaera sp. GP187]